MDLRWFRQNLFTQVVLEAFTMHAVYRLNVPYTWKVSPAETNVLVEV